MAESARHGRECAAWQRVRGIAGSVRHEVGSSTLSFRALVAESSNRGIQPFCRHFLDAATARSMTEGARHGKGCAAWQGVCGMAEGVQHDVGASTLSFRALVAESSNCGIQPFCGHFLDAATARSMTGGRGMTEGARYDGGCAVWQGVRSMAERARHDRGCAARTAMPRVSGAQGPAYAEPCFAFVSSLVIASRITNFCTLPVTVSGKSSTKRTMAGTLKCAILSLQ